MSDLERLEKALYYLKKENEIAKKMLHAKIEKKDIRKLRKKFKDLKAESIEYENEQKTIIHALLHLNEDLSLNQIDSNFLEKL